MSHRRYSILQAGSGVEAQPLFTLDFTGGVLPSGTTHARTDTGLQLGDSGELLWGPANLIPHSEDLDNAAWAPTNLAAGFPQAGTPAGGLPPELTNSWLIRDDGVTASGRYHIGQTNINPLIQSHPRHMSAYVAQGPTDQIGSKRWRYREFPAGSNSKQPWFDVDGFTVLNVGNCINVAVAQQGSTPFGLCEWDIDEAGTSNRSDPQYYIADYANHAAAGDDIYITGVVLNYAPCRKLYLRTQANAVYGPRLNSTGLLVETAATQHIANGRTLSGWTLTLTRMDAPGAFGDSWVNSTGSHLTATAAGQVARLTLSLASATRTFTCYVRGKTVTGDITFSPDGGATVIPMTPYLLSGNWERFSHTFVSSSTNLEIKINNNADDFDIDMVTLADEPWPQMPMVTTGTATDRVADTLTIEGLNPSEDYLLEVTSTQYDGQDPFSERAGVTSDGSGNYVFSWDDFPASKIRRHLVIQEIAVFGI